mgnify:CR=1 FL=1
MDEKISVSSTKIAESQNHSHPYVRMYRFCCDFLYSTHRRWDRATRSIMGCWSGSAVVGDAGRGWTGGSRGHGNVSGRCGCRKTAGEPPPGRRGACGRRPQGLFTDGRAPTPGPGPGPADDLTTIYAAQGCTARTPCHGRGERPRKTPISTHAVLPIARGATTRNVLRI